MLESICTLLSINLAIISIDRPGGLLDDTYRVRAALRAVRALLHVLGRGLRQCARQCAAVLFAVHQLRSLRVTGEWAGVGGGEKIVFRVRIPAAPRRLPRRGDQHLPVQL